ncbi:hypothetical protein GF068_19425 [Polyangium spumosum]|uniref:Uncharacterized protein n=1 Tax=Polyangium spumosum TaxID=889282 RepID=A0A6N7PQ13_9BACT|nr:hypothetical protein [Polyangium spumosum]
MTELVSGADPATQKALADRHLARARRPRSVKAMPAARPAERGSGTYLRPAPTRSRVLNAFLHEAGVAGLLSPDVHVLDEQKLAPRLVELARRYFAPMLAAAGNVEGALRIVAELPEVTSERGARLVVRRALSAPGPLGAAARDYEEHRRKTSAPEHDDLEGQAILAAFAGRIVAQAERLLGPHVREEVGATLRKLAPPRAEGRPARKPSVRMPQVSGPGAPGDKKRNLG